MTAVGKILVFVNLLISVAVVGMIALVFTTRANWKAEYEKMRNVALVAEAAYKTEKLAHESDLKSRDSQVDSQNKVIGVVTTERDAALKLADEEKAKRAQADGEKGNAQANQRALSGEVDSLKTERTSLTDEMQRQRALRLETQKELNDEKLRATNNKIEADSQRARAERMLNRVEELEKNVTQLSNRLTSLGVTGATSTTSSLLNPPPVAAPRDVYGTIMAVSTNGLTVVNIGSDSGISSGNKLYVMRVDNQNPKNSLYLGELVVSRTEPKQAVGQFYPKPFAKPDERLPKKDDVVSTSLGSR